MGNDEFESLTTRIGSRAAAEFVLLAVAWKCGDRMEQWKKAGELGDLLKPGISFF